MFLYNGRVLAKNYWDLAYKIHENFAIRSATRKNRVYLQPFSEMAQRFIDLYKTNFPKQKIDIDNFYGGLLKLLPKVEIKKDEQNK